MQIRFPALLGTAALLIGMAGCAGGSSAVQTPMIPGASAPLVLHPHATFKTLYDFGSATNDGVYPHGPLVDVSGVLYGVTLHGGAHNDDGTAYSLTTAGVEHVIWSFGQSGDGINPAGALVGVSGTLYGATTRGGASTYGTVFGMTTAGANEHLVHSFSYNQTDGYAPAAGMIVVGGSFYGTTDPGGTHGGGTVYSITGGTEKVVHSFGATGDGSNLLAAVTALNGTLYGTTCCGGLHGDGTVFSLTPSGTEKVLHSFNKTGDGWHPAGDLVALNGTLYGTTQFGGTNGSGIVFSITPSGTYKVLYNFGKAPDAVGPEAGLVVDNGLLYGVSDVGGKYGYGAIFSVNTTGTETRVHDFGPGSVGGSNPRADLIAVGTSLYGTTENGGTHGRGTAFSFTP